MYNNIMATNITKEEIIAYFKEHKEELFDFCEAFDLKFPFNNREELMNRYNKLKETRDSLDCLQTKDLKRYCDLFSKMREMEMTYHIFDKEYDEKLEERFIPKEYGIEASKVFEYRKRVFDTSNICHDYNIDLIIKKDISEIQEEKGGQEELYQYLPLCFSKANISKESVHFDNYLNSNVKCTTRLLRSYALDSWGGLVIIEERYYVEPVKKEKEEGDIPFEPYYTSNFQILTLGEDDGNYFVSSSHLHELYTGDELGFFKLFGLVQKNFRNFSKNIVP